MQVTKPPSLEASECLGGIREAITISIDVVSFFAVFHKNVLAARVGSTVAKGAFMQKFENGVFWLLKGTEKGATLGGKISLFPAL